MRVFHCWLSLLLLGVLVASAEAELNNPGGEIAWVSWSPEVFAQARAEQRLVLLDLTAEWCEFCRKMDATTYRDPRVLELINRDYIAVRADEKDQPELAKRYEKAGRPATVIFNSEGTEIIRKRGYIKPQWMVWFLQAVAANPTVEAHRVAHKQ